MEKAFVQVRSATVRFAGDSGDGMQLAGTQFADVASLTGTVVRTLPDFPSEVRAPTGSLGGVSGFQISFGDQDELQPGGIIIANEDEFTPDNLAKAGCPAQTPH